MRAAAPRQSLDYWLEGAQGVVILPGVYQAGFFYSVQGGEGVAITRKSDGLWSSPAFMSLVGAGFGIQAGLEKTRLVLVINDRDALAEILAKGFSFDVTARYTMLNLHEVTGPSSATRDKPVIAVSDGVGVMAGVGLRGAVLSQNTQRTARYHGSGPEQAQTVLQGSSAPGMEVWDLWDALTVRLPAGTIQQGKGTRQ